MAFAVPGIYISNSLSVIGSSFVTRLPDKKKKITSSLHILWKCGIISDIKKKKQKEIKIKLKLITLKSENTYKN